MEKARLIILTDIGPWDAEPDDAQSLVRLMLYSNEYDIEGIIPNASWCRPDTSDEGFLTRITDVIHAYGKVRDNLLVHAKGYPTEEYLLSVVKRGTSYVDMEADDFDWPGSDEQSRKDHITNTVEKGLLKKNVGRGLSNDGSRLIQRSIEKDDGRTLWIALWGGCGTLAQALYDMSKQYTKAQMDELCKKITVYDIDGQDDCGGWICHNFSTIKWMRSDMSFWGFSEDSYVGNLENISKEWIKANIQSKGELGKVYPLSKYGMETDSPSFLNLVHNGLSDCNHQNWGGWGGRHTFVKSKNVPAEHFRATYMREAKPFYMHRDDVDTWYDKYTGKTLHKNIYSSIARWRDDYQNDMAVRMLWSVNDKYESCNHNPVVVLGGDATKDAVVMNVKCGDIVKPDTAGTYDPDGDDLTFKWYVYGEAGTYQGNVRIENDCTASPFIHIPEDAINEEIHIILEVCDNGKDFPLKSYRRLILRTGDSIYGKIQTYVNDTDFEYCGNWQYKTNQYGAHNDDIHISNEAGDVALLKFKGNRIMLFGGAFDDNGIAEITIDDMHMSECDFYSNVNRWENVDNRSSNTSTGDTLQYISPYLDDGEHILKITVKGEKNSDSKGCFVVIDKAVIMK